MFSGAQYIIMRQNSELIFTAHSHWINFSEMKIVIEEFIKSVFIIREEREEKKERKKRGKKRRRKKKEKKNGKKRKRKKI